MNGKKIIYAVIFLATIVSLVYYIRDTDRKFFEMNKCAHSLVEVALSVKAQVERKMKEIEYIISNSEDQEKMKLIAENLELKWQNEKLIRELLAMFSLLRGQEVPSSRPLGEINM